MRAYFGLMFCFLLGSAADSATLERVSGDVSINRGSGYLPVKGATSVKPGDTIMASPGARGEVVYDSSCRVPVEPGALHVVAAKSPCSRQAEWSPPSKLGGCSLKGDSSGCRIEPEPDRRYLLIGAAVVGAGVGAIILLTDDKPSSP
jgi:hypothetical protein